MSLKKGRRYFILTPRHMNPPPHYIRDKIVLKYRALLEGGGYRRVRIFKQIFKVMRVCSKDKEYITKGEFIAIMRERLDTSIPVKGEAAYLNTEISRFRKLSMSSMND